MGKATDANVALAAAPRRGAARVVCEELAMALLDVGIPMPARAEHEIDITPQVVIRVVASPRDERIDEHLGKLEIQRVFAGAEELVIVDAAPAPVLRLFAEDVPARVERRVGGAPENAVGMRVSRRSVVVNHAVVAEQRGAVVVPVHGHRQCVPNE